MARPATGSTQLIGDDNISVVETSSAGGHVSIGTVQQGTTNWVPASGSANAIAASYNPAVTALVDGQECYFRALAANSTTTPTFTPNSGVITPRVITRLGGAAFAVGSIAGVDYEVHLRYKLASTCWEMLNPAASVSFASATDYLTATEI